jgi:hypothetical protein
LRSQGNTFEKNLHLNPDASKDDFNFEFSFLKNDVRWRHIESVQELKWGITSSAIICLLPDIEIAFRLND